MADSISPKAYKNPCGCGAVAGQPCPHTPIRCEHEFWYGEFGTARGVRRYPSSPVRGRWKVGELRTCELCGFQQRSRFDWELVRSAYPATPLPGGEK